VSVTSETQVQVDASAEEAAAKAKAASRFRFRLLGIVIVSAVLLNIGAFILFPPFPPGGAPGDACAYPVCFINGNLEFPPPIVVWDADPNSTMPSGSLSVGFDVSITNTLITMWIVEILILLVAVLATRRMRDIPHGVQNVVEWAYEGMRDFAISNGGAAATRHVPIFAAFFLFILFCNWSGLVPPVGKVEFLRAPTSDVNVTIGLALVAFGYFEFQGFRAHGLGYLSKFFPFYEFRHGVGAGLIAMFVGLVELMLEFVKPVTLAMRLFGNIYGGEVALAVMTALTLAVVPVAIFSLEVMLNFVQALIFSTLTLMFTLVAVESHHEEGELGEEGVQAVEDVSVARHGAAPSAAA
jgi:F-type H+-transporting ATPase subunit a